MIRLKANWFQLELYFKNIFCEPYRLPNFYEREIEHNVVNGRELLWYCLLVQHDKPLVGKYGLYRVFNLKMDRILIRVIYLLRFTTCYITQLTRIYSKCWKLCKFMSMNLSTRFTMFLATLLSLLSFLIIFAIALFTGAYLLNFSKNLCLQWA